MSTPLVEVRRHLHAHPELGWSEHASTAYVHAQLTELGLAPTVLSTGVGLVADIGLGDGPAVLLRADLDALPIADSKGASYSSTVSGVCHACGHDVHTTVLLGAARDLVATPPPGRVRLLFQAAEEVMPGGALSAMEQGVLDGVGMAFAVHCDPSLDVGQVGLRTGPLTAASDHLEFTVRGPGGHTSRPYNTVDVVHVLASIISGLPGELSRVADPRAAMSVVFGAVHAGSAFNAIPKSGTAQGTVRALDRDSWDAAPELVTRLIERLAAVNGADAEVHYMRGVPPVVNDAVAIAALAGATEDAFGPGHVAQTRQSMGGEDFGWVLEAVPGAMARLGTHTPGGPRHELHQSGFDVDEGCIPVGAAVLAGAARRALSAR